MAFGQETRAPGAGMQQLTRKDIPSSNYNNVLSVTLDNARFGPTNQTGFPIGWILDVII